MLKSINHSRSNHTHLLFSLSKMNHQMVHESSSDSHPTFPFIAVAIIGIIATILFLVFYYIFVIKCCLNWHRIDILRRFSLSRNTNQYHHPIVVEPMGLDESVIRSIPIFHFKKQKHSDNECAVCLGEFQDDEKLRIIPNCAHVFHIDCIDVWLQNNPNCPLCRNSISISHGPVVPDLPPRVRVDEGDYIVIELHGGGSADVGEGRTIVSSVSRDDQSIKCDEPVIRKRIKCDEHVIGKRIKCDEPVTGKLTERLRKRYGYDSSMGDECIGVNSRGKGEDQFLVQPIRRSFSMDSGSDQQLFLAVQEIRNSLNQVDGCRSLKRGLFSFGRARSAILPSFKT